jgi:2-isopropylmalate synthase
VATGTSTVPTATVRLKKGADVRQDSACGDGPVDATLKTIDRITGIQGELLDYSLQAVTRGEDAVGEVSVRVAFGRDKVAAKGASTDIVEASAKAYLNALNTHVFTQAAGKKRSDGKPDGPNRGDNRKKKGSGSRVRDANPP